MRSKLKVLSLCDGISMGLEALKRLGYEVEYHAIEICPNKRFISDTNHPGIIRPCNDVLELAAKGVTEYYDILIAGPTCTSLSSQGKREDWNGESKIFFDCVKILEAARSVNPEIKFFFENVYSMKNVCRDDISRVLGVDAYLGESRYYSAQDRKRYYWYNFDKPTEIVDAGITANSILDEDGLVLVAFSKSNRNEPGEPPIVEGRVKVIPKANTITTGAGGRGQSTWNAVFTKKMTVRNLSVQECARLQGAENYIFDFVSDALAYSSLGDGWNIPTVVELFKGLKFDRMEDDTGL